MQDFDTPPIMKKTALIIATFACMSAYVLDTHNRKLPSPDISIEKTKPGTTLDFYRKQGIFNQNLGSSGPQLISSGGGGFGIRNRKRKDKPVRLVV